MCEENAKPLRFRFGRSVIVTDVDIKETYDFSMDIEEINKVADEVNSRSSCDI